MIQRYIALTFIVTCALSTSAIASDDRTLSSVANADGYTYTWLPTEAGIVLTKPGLRIVLRAGRLFYEVNNATPIADRAPFFNGDDLVISPALATRLGEIAQRSSSPTSLPVTRPAAMIGEHPASAPRALTIATKLIPGRNALALSGTGTPNTALTITLTGEISKDLPIVVIRRAPVTVAADGTYAIEMPYGPDAHNGTIITATATSPTSSVAAVAHVTVSGEPTGVTSTSLDDWPKN